MSAPITIRKLVELLNKAVEGLDDGQDLGVEVWVNNDQMKRIVRVGQFSVVPHPPEGS